ncbi:MAG: hypothetical protein WBL35_13710 [Ornithinibacter sp.]
MAVRARRLTAAAAIALVAAVVLPSTAVADIVDEQNLADRYAPVVRLVEQDEKCGPGEPFLPTDVDTILDNDTVALRGPWLTDDLVKIAPSGQDLGRGLPGYHLDFPGNPLSPGCDYEQWARTVTAGSDPTVYARVLTEEGHSGLALQYWLYYPFNDFNNKHESDWEMIQLEFDSSDPAEALGRQPTLVGYSQHEGVEVAQWSDLKLEVVDDSHPVVHAASGSHANYYDAALFLGRSGQQGFGCDDTRASTVDVRPRVALLPQDDGVAAETYPWIDYEGRWGQRETSFYNGPTGPNTKDQWTAPFTWSEEEGRPLSYAVPASGLFGTQATTFFCQGVSGGSDLLRLAMQNPLPAAALLTLAVALIAWLVSRTTWRGSAPLRLARRRSVGQVVASTWQMYAGHVRLFTGIGVPVAIATILPGLAQLWLASAEESVVSAGGDTTGLLWTIGGSAFVAILAPVAAVLGESAVVLSVVDLDEGREPGVWRAYRRALARWRPLLLTGLVVGVSVSLALLTVVLIPLAVALYVLWVLWIPVIQVEGLSGRAALRRSASLVRPRWAKVVLLVVIATATASAIGPALGALIIIVTNAPFAVSNAVAGIAYALLLPLVSLSTTYVYADASVCHRLHRPSDRPEALPAEASLG